MIQPPKDIQIIGNELAILWPDGRENYFHAEQLRAGSPSAENIGEPDILGKIHGGDPRTEFPVVRLKAWYPVGNYAIRLAFSDGHASGLFSWQYLQHLASNKQHTDQQ